MFRPLIATVGLAGARVLAAVSVALVTWSYWFSVKARIGRTAATLATTVLVLTLDVIDLPGSLVHALAWTMAVGSVAMTAVHGRTAQQALARTTITAGAWIAGFSWLWMTKWVLYAAVAGVDRAWDDVTGQIGTRLGGDVDAVEVSAAAAIGRVLTDWWTVALTPIVLPLVALSTVWIAVRWRSAGIGAGARAVMAAPAVIPLVWYATLRIHTYLHSWFVHRSSAVSAALVVVAVLAGRTRRV